MFTRKAFISLISILLCCWNSVVLAQYPSLLWEISGNGLEKPSYLYGTVHTGDERVFAFGDSTKIAWDNTEVVAGELVFSKDSATKIMKYIMLPKGKQLSDYMTEKDYERVMKFAEKHMGSSAVAIKKMKPIYSAYYLAKVASSKKSKHPQREQSLDEYLQLFAKEEHKDVVGLELYAEQLAAIDHIPMEEQIKALNETVTKKSKSNDD